MSILIPAAAALEPSTVAPDHVRFTIGEDWLQGRSCFGGLQAALALVAMRRLTGVTAPLRVLQVAFLAPVPPGEVMVTARLLRAGKSVTQIEARLEVADQPLCLVTGVFGVARESAIRLPMPSPALPQSPENLRDLPYLPGVLPTFLQHYAQRYAEGHLPFTGGREAATRIWLRCRDANPMAEEALVMLADVIPSPALSLLKTFSPASSLSWMLELLEPAPPQGEGWWRLDNTVHGAADGYISQTAVLHTPDNRPVALSRQTVVVFG